MYIAVSESIKDQPVDFKKEDTVILVVGGSTTEIMMMSNGKMAGVHSLRLGTVRIDQQMRNQGSSYSDIQRYVRESINNTKGSLESELNISEVKQFIAIGSDMTLAALLVGRPISTFLWEIKKEGVSKVGNSLQAHLFHFPLNRILYLISLFREDNGRLEGLSLLKVRDTGTFRALRRK